MCTYVSVTLQCHASGRLLLLCFPQIRQSAGLLLKNNLKQQYAGSPPAFQEYIKVTLLH